MLTKSIEFSGCRPERNDTMWTTSVSDSLKFVFARKRQASYLERTTGFEPATLTLARC